MLQTDIGLAPAPGLETRFEDALNRSPDHRGRLFGLHWEISENSPLLDSANIVPADWETIADQCLDHESFDGVVVVHGTDTLAYSASALAFLLQSIKVPVVVTGAQKPLGVAQGDALDNLVGAMDAAAHTPAGVWVYFNQQLMPGARVVKKDAIGFGGFDSPRLLSTAAGEHEQIRLSRQQTARDWSTISVAVAYMTPGFAPTQLNALVSTGPRAIVLPLFGLGTLADRDSALLKALDEARQQGIPVCAISQCYIGRVDFSVYATGNQLTKMGVLSGGDITLEAAYAKLMVLFRLGYSVDQIRSLFRINLANEMSNNK